MGRIGMSLDDFDRCDPSEFQAILKAWDMGERAKWERMRIHAAISLIPWSKSGISPSKICPLPWDGSEGIPSEILSRDEAKKRFDNLMTSLEHGEQGQHD